MLRFKIFVCLLNAPVTLYKFITFASLSGSLSLPDIIVIITCTVQTRPYPRASFTPQYLSYRS